MNGNNGPRYSRRKALLVLTASVASVIVAALLVLDMIPGLRGDPGASDSSNVASRSGFLYAGIPARIEFMTDTGEAIRMNLKNVPDGDLRRGGLSTAKRLDGAWDILVRTGSVFNPFDPSSELAILNSNQTTSPVQVSDWMAQVAGSATTVSQMTSGAFDATVRPLKTIWKNAAQSGVLPDEADITHALGRMGWGYVTLLRDGEGKWEIARNRPAMELDFGGIVKGWSVGMAMTFLQDNGVKSALVQVGGEIALAGNSPSGRPWRIGIRHPLEPGSNWTILNISGRTAVSTSGNYEQPVMIGNTAYYHIFDPITGRPIPTDVLGTTVVVSGGPNPNAIADGLATAFAVMGPDRAIEAAAKMDGVEVLFIVRDPASGAPKERTTPGFDRFRH